MTIGDKRSWTHLCLGKFLGAFAKLREATIGLVKPVCPSVRLHGTTRLPLCKFAWKLIFV